MGRHAIRRARPVTYTVRQPSSGLAVDHGETATHVLTGVSVPYAILARRRPEPLPSGPQPPEREQPPGEFVTPK